MQQTISVNEWLAELEKLEKDHASSDGFTTGELAESFKCGEAKTRIIIRKLILIGVVLPVKVRRTSILNGVVRFVPGFKLKKKKS